MRTRIIGTALALALLACMGTAVSPARTAAATGYQTFLNHEIAFLGSMVPIMGDLSDAMDEAQWTWSGYHAYLHANQLLSKSKAEIKWLNAHPPATCYKGMWKATLAQWTDLNKAMTYWRPWLRDFPYGSMSQYEKGSYWFDKFNRQLTYVNGLYDRTWCGVNPASA